MTKKSELWAKGWGISQDIGDLERKKREWFKEWNELQLEREKEKNKTVWLISRVVFVGVPWILLYFYALVMSMLEFYSFVEGWIKNG